MNKEEAIEYLKNYKYDNEVKQAIDTVLDYIEELEKENAVKESHIKIVSAYNEELEEKLKIQTENYNSAYEDINWFCDKYIPKQKIKELKEKIHNTLDNNGITRAYQIKIDEYFEELLESEN